MPLRIRTFVRRPLLTTALARSHRVGGDRGGHLPRRQRPDRLPHGRPETGFGVPLLRAMPDGTQVTELNERPGFFTDWRADGERIAFDFFERDGDEQIAT